jgi:hypothetical protein
MTAKTDQPNRSRWNSRAPITLTVAATSIIIVAATLAGHPGLAEASGACLLIGTSVWAMVRLTARANETSQPLRLLRIDGLLVVALLAGLAGVGVLAALLG